MTVVERNRVIGRYRSAPHNVLIGATLLLSGMLAVQVERNGSWTWRVPVLGALELVLLIRAGRRAVLVSDFGLEGHGLLVSWRAPWSSIESFGVGDARSEPTMAAPGRLTVTFRDGRVHCARLGRGRRHDPLFAAAVDEARRNHSPAPRWCRYENVPLVGFIVASLALVVVLAVNDNFRANKQADARLPVELSDPKAFDVEIWITGLLAVVLGAVALTTGVAALRQAMTAAPHTPATPGHLTSWTAPLVATAEEIGAGPTSWSFGTARTSSDTSDRHQVTGRAAGSQIPTVSHARRSCAPTGSGIARSASQRHQPCAASSSWPRNWADARDDATSD